MTILGEYSYSNFSVVNAFALHENGIESTHLHEMLHLALTKTTEYGLFSTIVNRVVRFDPAYEYLNKILIRHMIRLQEGISTFSEVIYHAEKTSYEGSLVFLKELKISNRQYYNYVHPHLSRSLLFTNKSNEEKYHFTPLELFDLVYKLAFIAMSCSLSTIPLEVMVNKKRFKPYVEQRNPKLYIPNSRFNMLLKKLNNLLNSTKGKSISTEIILKTILEDFNNRDFYLDILSDTEKRDQYTQTYISATKKYIQDLFSGSNQKNLISETINQFNAKHVDIQKLHHHVVPGSFKAMYKVYKINEKDVVEFISNDCGVFFIIADNSYKETINTASVYVHESVFKKIKELYPVHVQLMYMSLIQKKSFCLMYPIANLNVIFLQDDIPVVVNYKLVEFIDKIILNTARKVFIYCDRPYISAVETINDYATTNKPARILAYSNMDVVIVRISDNIDLFLPIISNLLPDVVNDINSGVLNLTIDENLEINFKQYDTIINTLFNL